jgi:nicotinate-nucleotide pyrophosphorylase (carboxylating)
LYFNILILWKVIELDNVDSILKKDLLAFLREDVGFSDITTNAIVPKKTRIIAHIIVQESAVVAGILEAKTFFNFLGIEVTNLVKDGDEVSPGTTILEVNGEGRTILTAERTVLNLLMRMSGIATKTNRLTKKIRSADYNVIIAATRKTAPGLRYFDKKAVSIGGGDPHRFRLDDSVLIKDNHIAIAKGIDKAIKKVRSVTSFSKKIEVEAKTIEQAIEATKAGADIVMLDNMELSEVEKTMKTLVNLKLRSKVLVEISGEITEDNIINYAKFQPDIISLGSLTHSVIATNISLEVLKVEV